jgi:hypothetical protein
MLLRGSDAEGVSEGQATRMNRDARHAGSRITPICIHP